MVGKSTCCGLSDLLERGLGRAIRVEQTIGLLIRIGELRVAEAGQSRQAANRLQQFAVAADQLLRCAGTRITPYTIIFAEGDAAELRQHNRVLPGLIVADKKHSTARTFPLEEMCFDVVDAVSSTDTF